MSSNIINNPSPNFDDRDPLLSLDYVILHYTGMKSGEEALARLSDPYAKVSSHYLIEENGDVYQMVDGTKRAWHAGQSYWQGIIDMNSASIGVEIVNPGHEWGYRKFPDKQMDSVLNLCQSLKKKYEIKSHNFLAHSDVAPDRKHDPGELFDWRSLSREGIGFYPEEGRDYEGADPNELLRAIGYNPDISLDVTKVAFCRHFYPEALVETGEYDDCEFRARVYQVSEIFKN